MNIKILSRTNDPSKLDTADQYTLCEDRDHQWYIQLSPNAEQPKWEYLGKLDSPNILIKLIDMLK